MIPPIGQWPVADERWRRIERALDFGSACVERIEGDEDRGEILTVTIRVDPADRNATERYLADHKRDVDELRRGGAVDWPAFFARRDRMIGQPVLRGTVAMMEVKVARRIEAERRGLEDGRREARKEERR